MINYYYKLVKRQALSKSEGDVKSFLRQNFIVSNFEKKILSSIQSRNVMKLSLHRRESEVKNKSYDPLKSNFG